MPKFIVIKTLKFEVEALNKEEAVEQVEEGKARCYDAEIDAEEVE